MAALLLANCATQDPRARDATVEGPHDSASSFDSETWGSLDLSKITAEDYETRLNPFGDPWAWKKAPNIGFPVAASGPVHVYELQGDNNSPADDRDLDGAIREAHARYVAKSNAPILYLDGTEPHGRAHTYSYFPAFFARVKALNPAIKLLSYAVAWQSPPEKFTVIENNGDPYYEAMLVHAEDDPTLRVADANGPIFDITNPSYRAWVIPRLVAYIGSSNLDGVMLDELRDNKQDAWPSMPEDTKAAWPGAIAQFVEELKAEMARQGHSEWLVFGNVDDDDPEYTEEVLLQPGRLDGVIFEDPFNARPDPGSIPKVNTLLDILDRFDKKSMLLVSGAYNAAPEIYPRSEAIERAAARYYYGAYLMVMRGPNHELVFHTSTSIVTATGSPVWYSSEAFFREWDLDLGAPLNNVENAGGGVLVRRFERGNVYWNATNEDFVVHADAPYFDIDNGEPIEGQVVPAQSSAFFVDSALLREHETPPAR